MLHNLFFDTASLGLVPEAVIIPWLLTIIWGVYFLESFGPKLMSEVDVRGDPKTIITAQLGHQNLKHIAGNSAGAILLIHLYLKVTDDPWLGLAVMFFGSSGLFWLLGPKNHNHGRGLSYFLFAMNAWFLVYLHSKGYGLIFLASTVIIVKHVLPGSKGAWDGHLSGFLVGLGWNLYEFGHLQKWID